MLLQELNFVPHSDIVKPSVSSRFLSRPIQGLTRSVLLISLPWRVSLTSKRRTETTRPIFWSNRQKSSLSRTSDWDEVSFYSLVRPLLSRTLS